MASNGLSKSRHMQKMPEITGFLDAETLTPAQGKTTSFHKTREVVVGQFLTRHIHHQGELEEGIRTVKMLIELSHHLNGSECRGSSLRVLRAVCQFDCLKAVVF